MKRILGACFALVLLAAPARAVSLHPALELEGGLATQTVDTGTDSQQIDSKLRPLFGAGVTVGSDPAARVALRTGVFYRYSQTRFEVTDPDYSDVRLSSDRKWSTVRVPVRVSFAPSASGPWRLEAGVTGRYLIKATEKLDVDGVYPLRRVPAQSGAVIFETLDDERDITDYLRRGDVLLTAGLGWNSRVGGHATSITARFEQGLYDLARDEPTSHQAERSFQLGLSIGWSVAD